MRRFILISAAAAAMMWNMAVSSFAGWESTATGWAYKNDKTGEYVRDGWQWIDGNGDGISECYYFADGILLTATKTPDGFLVDNNGAKLENGVVAARVSARARKTEEGQEYDAAAAASAFVAENREQLDRLLAGAQAKGHVYVLTEMERPEYTNMINNIPAEGICYPAQDGYGIQLNANYLYYGQLSGGKAEGEGAVYNVKTGSSPSNRKNTTSERYSYHVGSFADNAANGPGEDTIYYHDSAQTVQFTGDYRNWYQNGDMTCIYNRKGGRATFHYQVSDKMTPSGKYRVINGSKVAVTAYAEETKNSDLFLAMNGSAQTAAHIIIEDNVTKNVLCFNK